MSKLKINGKEYELETLPEDIQAHVASFNYVESEIKRTAMHLAALNTAKNAYGQALRAKLSEASLLSEDESVGGTEDGLGENITFD